MGTPLLERLGLGFLRPVRRPGGLPDVVLRPSAAGRIAFSAFSIVIGFGAVLGKAGSLMLLPDGRLEEKARVQFEDTVTVQGRRGDILDRNGAILATTVDLFELRANPSLLVREVEPEVPTVADPARLLAEALAPVLRGATVEALYEKLSRSNRQDERLAFDLTPTDISRVRAAVREVAKKDRRIRGATLREVEQPTRFYPGREDAAPLLGLVGPAGPGAAGLEMTLDRYLHGETYKFIRWRDRKNRTINASQRPANEGRSVVLTIDRRIQHIAEEAAEAAMIEHQADAAWVVVTDIPTGEILALVNRPTLNPNDREGLDMFKVKNRAVMDAIEPGSVFKPFVAAAAIEEGLVRPETPIDCEGGTWFIGRKPIHDDHPHGVVSITEVIKYSSNIGSAKLAFMLGAERTIEYLKDFGFARSTGLELPGETRGQMRNSKDIKPIELATTAYGHGVTANAIQLAAAMATLGNGGVRMEPRLVRAIQDADGRILEKFPPVEDRQVLSRKTAEETILMMESVVEKGGTGTRAAVPGFRSAGKTGTAWKHVEGGYSDTDRISSYLGLVPSDKPRLAIAVVVDTPRAGSKYGGIVAAPAFSTIASESLRLLGVEPDPALLPATPPPLLARARPAAPLGPDGKPFDIATLPKNEAGQPLGTDGQPLDLAAFANGKPEALLHAGLTPPPDPGPERPRVREMVWTPEGHLRAPDLVGLSLRDAFQVVEGAGVSISSRGTGRVLSQTPAPGTPLVPGSSIEIQLR